MSKNKKKFKRQKQRQKFPWLPPKARGTIVFAALGGALLLVAALLLANRTGGDGGGTPSIAVDQQKIDYGDVKLGDNKSFAIKVTNTSDGTLRFKEDPYIEVVEGC